MRLRRNMPYPTLPLKVESLGAFPVIKEGEIAVPEGKGVGIEVNEGFVGRHPSQT